MINDHRRFNLATLDGGHVEVEVNFHDGEKIKDSKVLRFFIGNKQYDIKTKDIVDLLLAVGSVNVKKDLLPVKVTRVRKLQRMLQYEFKASKDYKRGEVVTVVAPFIDTHTDVEEALSGAVKNIVKNKSQFKI
uniref:Uncharacterized protein n=1 Tax=viral metagenome TaxID=1070528 RepID=A0A6H1ZHM7_9ZZZZ